MVKKDKEPLTETVRVDQPIGPVKKRSCHDIFWLLLFFLFIAGMGLLSWQAFITGDPRLLLYV